MRARFVAIALSSIALGVGVSGVASSAEKADWPQEIINRPLTLPEGSYSIGTGFGSDAKFDDPSLDIGGLWGASYGFTNEFSAGASYSMALGEENAGKGTLGVGAGYTYYAEGPLILTGDAGLSYDLVTESAAAAVGSWLWFNATPWLAIISPGSQLEFGLSEPNPVTFSLPVGVGFQIIPAVFAQLDTTLASFLLNNGGAASIIGRDETPLSASVYVSPTKEIDISVGGGFGDIAPDVGSATDTAYVAASFIYYGNVD